ncbi:hypothetical protein EVB91_211 [Rhizobium phage RHph_I1_18]|nr:hypothetical protein EVB91_211 [Rhizobium phage RHph_I1_18]
MFTKIMRFFGWMPISIYEDKVDGLEADLEHAVRLAYHRGAWAWVKMNYPALYNRLQSEQ